MEICVRRFGWPSLFGAEGTGSVIAFGDGSALSASAREFGTEFFEVERANSPKVGPAMFSIQSAASSKVLN